MRGRPRPTRQKVATLPHSEHAPAGRRAKEMENLQLFSPAPRARGRRPCLVYYQSQCAPPPRARGASTRLRSRPAPRRADPLTGGTVRRGARGMARKGARRLGDKPAGRDVSKVTLTLPDELCRRLAVVAASRRVTMSAVAAELLEPYLRKWRLPVGPGDPPAGGAGGAGDAA